MSLKRFGFTGLVLSATLGLGACAPTPVYYGGEAEVEVESEPPAPQVEARPVEPYGGAVWIEGHWYWRGRWVWYPGRWDRPRTGWAWVPHHYQRYGRHWRDIPGHWQRV